MDLAVVCTTVDPSDDAVARFCAKNGIECFRGSEDDVLDRFYRAAERHEADAIVRVTADCPLLDPEVVDRVVRAFVAGGFDYASNVVQPTYPDGLDTEVFSAAALEAAWRHAEHGADREHVTPWMRTSGTLRIGSVTSEGPPSLQNLRWTVDERVDLEFVRAVYEGLGRNGSIFSFRAVLAFLERHPELQRMNHTIANEGFYRSLLDEPPMAPRERTLERSRELAARAETLIPSCSQTFSKAPSQYVQGVAPVFLERGEGSRVWDVDGNEYVDLTMALCPVILGYGYPRVVEAVSAVLPGGTTFSLPHRLEVEVAELLAETLPVAEMVRFGKNGSDATSGAVRVARAYTGRKVIACCGYHGWQDWYIGTTTRSRGVPEEVARLTKRFDYNDLGSLERIFEEHPGEVAAVVMEPIGVEEPQDGFLEGVRDLTRREGALLVFDEIVTGFRLAIAGAEEFFGVTPDLSCIGKAMGNGFPISAVVGPAEIMRVFDEVFFSFTFGGEIASLAAAQATILELKERDVIERLWTQGQKLKDGYNVLARELGVSAHTECVGLPPRTVLTYTDADGRSSLVLKSLFQQECLKRGVLFSGAQNLCFTHTDADVAHVLRAYRAAMEILAEAVATGDPAAMLEGEPVQPVFREP